MYERRSSSSSLSWRCTSGITATCSSGHPRVLLPEAPSPLSSRDGGEEIKRCGGRSECEGEGDRRIARVRGDLANPAEDVDREADDGRCEARAQWGERSGMLLVTRMHRHSFHCAALNSEELYELGVLRVGRKAHQAPHPPPIAIDKALTSGLPKKVSS